MAKAYAVVSYRSSPNPKRNGDLVATVVLEEPSPGLGAVLVTEIFRCPMSALGLGRVKTKSDLVVMPSGRQIFAFFCSPHDRRAQNSGCGYTA